MTTFLPVNRGMKEKIAFALLQIKTTSNFVFKE